MMWQRWSLRAWLVFRLVGLVLVTVGVPGWSAETPQWLPAGDGVWEQPTHWSTGALPQHSADIPLASQPRTIRLPATPVRLQQLQLAGNTALAGGQLQLAGGNAGIRAHGNNTLACDLSTLPQGNSITLEQADENGTLTLTGTVVEPMKHLNLAGQGHFHITGTLRHGSGKTLHVTNRGTCRVDSHGKIVGRNGSRIVREGCLWLNGTADDGGDWLVHSGLIGGTGQIQSSLHIGEPATETIQTNSDNRSNSEQSSDQKRPDAGLAPGDPQHNLGIGQLTVAGSLQLHANATVWIEYSTQTSAVLTSETNASSWDRLEIGGGLQIEPGAVLALLPAGPEGLTGGLAGEADQLPDRWVFLRHQGPRQGRFTHTFLPPGFRLDDSQPNELALVREPQESENIRFPADAGIIDVTQAPWNARPDDGMDDTAAIQAALDAYPNGNRIVYLPNGVYEIRQTLNWPAGRPGASDFKRTILQGQSQTGTILSLQPNSPDFQDPEHSRPVLYTGPRPAQRFRNAIRNLTVQIGSGNPGADGIQFNASNQGCIRAVTIRALDGNGQTGLNLAHTAEIGPLLVQDLTVIGFNYGIRTADAINSITLENITVCNQRQAGILNLGQVFSIHRLRSVNRVPALINNPGDPDGGLGAGGALTLIDALLLAPVVADRPAKPTEPDANAAQQMQTEKTSQRAEVAFHNGAFAYARQIRSAGYRLSRTELLRGYHRRATNDCYTQHFFSRTPITLMASTKRLDTSKDDETEVLAKSEVVTLNEPANWPTPLPIQISPTIPWGNSTSEWLNVRDCGAVGDGQTDDTSAIQRACTLPDRHTVYFPAGFTFRINGTVTIPAHIRRIIGTEGRLAGTGQFEVRTGVQPLLFERFNGLLPIVHSGNRPLLVQSCTGGAVVSDGSGPIYLEDLVSTGFSFSNPAQQIWARQLNTEGGESTNVQNCGARLWILGYKTEKDEVKIATSAGGHTELLGAHIYAQGEPKTTPLFTVTDATVSLINVLESSFDQKNYRIWVAEQRHDQNLSLTAQQLPPRTSANGKALPAYFSPRHPPALQAP